ncbi:MAG: zinc-ribbon domain-containing protein [Chloroflexota bacterium]
MKQVVDPASKPICPKCGTVGQPKDRFCRKCGNPLK